MSQTLEPAVGAPYTRGAASEGHRAALLASFLGWTLDAFDFFLVTFALTAIGKDFGRSDTTMAIDDHADARLPARRRVASSG